METLNSKQLMEIGTLMGVTVQTLYNNIEERPITYNSVCVFASSNATLARDLYIEARTSEDNVHAYIGKLEAQR